jgi:hypothetical protein
VRPTELPPSTAFLPGAHRGVCPTCGGPAQQSERYARAVCLGCAQSATCAAHGLPAVLGGDVGGLLGGLEPGHLDSDRSWDPCTHDGAVLVNGRLCRMQEARFGGMVIEADSPSAAALSPAASGHDSLRDLGERLSLRCLEGTSPDGLPEQYLYSKDMRYRYAFARWWGPQDLRTATLWVLLNPATGDTELRRRPTLERCIVWSRSWGSTGLVILNLFAYRATKPKALREVEDPVGPCNDQVLDALSGSAPRTLVAWGSHGSLHRRSTAVMETLHNPMCLGVTRRGEPRHPLYVASSTLAQPWPAVDKPTYPVG